MERWLKLLPALAALATVVALAMMSARPSIFT